MVKDMDNILKYVYSLCGCRGLIAIGSIPVGQLKVLRAALALVISGLTLSRCTARVSNRFVWSPWMDITASGRFVGSL